MTIASIIDKINDKFAGSDQPAAATIEKALELLLDNIEPGGGGELSPATADTLGGVKIGEGISVTSDGTISAAGDQYDAVIKGDDDGWSIVSGTYAALSALIEADKAPKIKAVFWNEVMHAGFETDQTAISYYRPALSVPDFIFIVLNSAGGLSSLALHWNANDELLED